MPHDTSLIVTVAVGVSLSFVFGAIANRFKLPPLLGYLLAGLAVGPFTPGIVADGSVAHQLSEIGVTLLMFGVGLHFSIRDLLTVRKVAVPGAIVQIAVATLLGTGAAKLWGMPLGASIVFGLCLSVASTVVLLRALADRNQVDSTNGRIAVGWLVVEDLAIVVALVALPALSHMLGGTPSETPDTHVGLTLAWTLLKVAAFVGLMLIIGKRVIPAVLGNVARQGSRELFVIGLVAISLGIAFGSAALFGVSPALGAFFAGVVIAESDLSHQAAAEIKPLEATFTVLFFVSVGMLFNPVVLLKSPLHVLSALGIVLVGKSVAAAVIVLWLRYPISAALTIAASLAQIGELSFILATLGHQLKLLSSEALSIVLAVGVVSIALNPLMFLAMDKLSLKLDKKRLTEGDGAPPSDADPSEAALAELANHVVMVGYGRVGSVVGAALDQCHVPYVVIEMDRTTVDALKNRGVPAVFGDATRTGVLNHARLPHAKLLVIATPANSQAREIVQAARSLRPEVPICVRTHHVEDVRYFAALNVERVVLGELETALEMAGFALATTLEDPRNLTDVIAALREEGPDVMRLPKRLKK